MPKVQRVAAPGLLQFAKFKSRDFIRPGTEWPSVLFASCRVADGPQISLWLAQSRRRSTANMPQKKPRISFSNRDRGRTRIAFNGVSVRQGLKNEAIIPILVDRLELLAEELMDVEFTKFAQQITTTLRDWKSPNLKQHPPPIYVNLRQAYVDRGQGGLDAQIKFAYHGAIANRNFSASGLDTQAKLADLRYPVEWYPVTRTVQREIHLHVGPTNSGKTYHALKRLEQAESGIYAGPLRLLAHEVYTRLNANGKACNLITGDERQINEDKNVMMSSCTVEMVPINTDVEVAVIDEIQMIGHDERGWAWTQALLGIQAKEVHLCGEERTVPLIRELAAAMGDKLEIHHYERLSPLKTMTTSLHGQLSTLRKGDCVVVFSRLGIHALRKEIEKTTKKRVAVVYGSLPPDTRAQQAKLFNDPNNDYDILVASDAIGMGLNLSIKRIIFETTTKWNGFRFEPIPISSVKQIAGRAGRYRTATQANNRELSSERPEHDRGITGKGLPIAVPAQNLGLVTTLEPMDLSVVRKAMQTEADPIMSAGIFPPNNILLQFAAHYPENTPFSYILLRLHELALKHPRFHLCVLKDQVKIADAIEPVKGLTISDRITFTAAPVNMRSPKMTEVLQALAKCVACNGGGGLLEIPEIDLDVLDMEWTTAKEYLNKLEDLHKALILYLWLSYRFTGVFTNQRMTFHVKTLVEEKIDKVLAQATYDKDKRKSLRKQQQKDLLRSLQVDEEEFSARDKEATIDFPITRHYVNTPSTMVIPDRTYRVLNLPEAPKGRPSAAAI